MKIGRATIHNCDNMELMKGCDDNQFDLAIVDPPYGIGDVFIPITTGKKAGKIERTHKIMEWDNDIPTEEYFNELERVSRKQVIWGANYFNCFKTGGALVWYKNNGAPTLSQCEIASLSFKNSIDYAFIQMLGGFVQKNKPIHPTQKPVALYEWLLKNYAKDGDLIFDSHMGSGSIAIATNKHGFDLTACELDEDYYQSACERIKQAHNQPDMFTPAETKPEQEILL